MAKLFQKPGSTNWHYRFTIHGREYKKSTGTADKREAEKVMRREWARLDGESADAKGPERPTLALMRKLDFERAREAGSSENHIERGLATNWTALIRYFGDRVDIDRDALRDYVKSRSADGVRTQTISRELGTLKRGMTLASDDFEIRIPARWPRLKLDPVAENRTGRFWGREKTRAWMEALTLAPAFDMALVMLLTGIRMHELARVTVDMVGDELLSLPRETTKADKARQMYLVPRAREALLRALPFTSKHAVAFCAAAKAAGIKGGRVHTRDLRATFATVAEEAGDSRGTDLAMGHHGEVAQRYQKSTTERLQKIALVVDEWLGPLERPAEVPATRKRRAVNAARFAK